MRVNRRDGDGDGTPGTRAALVVAWQPKSAGSKGLGELRVKVRVWLDRDRRQGMWDDGGASAGRRGRGTKQSGSSEEGRSISWELMAVEGD